MTPSPRAFIPAAICARCGGDERRAPPWKACCRWRSATSTWPRRGCAARAATCDDSRLPRLRRAHHPADGPRTLCSAGERRADGGWAPVGLLRAHPARGPTDAEEKASRSAATTLLTHVISYHEWLGHTVQIAAANAHVTGRCAARSAAPTSPGVVVLSRETLRRRGLFRNAALHGALKTRMARLQMRMWRVQRILTKMPHGEGEMTFDQAVDAYVKKIGMEPTNAFIEVQRDSQTPRRPGARSSASASSCNCATSTNAAWRALHAAAVQRHAAHLRRSAVQADPEVDVLRRGLGDRDWDRSGCDFHDAAWMRRPKGRPSVEHDLHRMSQAAPPSAVSNERPG